VVVLALLSGVAMAGCGKVSPSPLITLLEAGTLIVIIAAGAPWRCRPDALRMFSTGGLADVELCSAAPSSPSLPSSALKTSRTWRRKPVSLRAPSRGIVLTLVAISVAIYALVAIVAATYPSVRHWLPARRPLRPVCLRHRMAWRSDRGDGLGGHGNGILVQIVMASRVIYGMSREGMLPESPGPCMQRGRRRCGRSPCSALPSRHSACLCRCCDWRELTSFVMLLIFTAVNLSLFLIGRRADAPARLARWRYWGLGGAIVSLALAVSELAA
jgi:amino acid transporter